MIIFVPLSTLTIAVAGWPGAIGVACVAVNLLMRFYFKRAINEMDLELGKLTNARISTTI